MAIESLQGSPEVTKFHMAALGSVGGDPQTDIRHSQSLTVCFNKLAVLENSTSLQLAQFSESEMVFLLLSEVSVGL